MQRQGWKDWTWSQRRNLNYDRVRSTCDYILLEVRSDFNNFQVKQPRFDSDHRLIKAELKLVSKREHRQYVQKRELYPISVPLEKQNLADKLLADLADSIKPPSKDPGNHRHNSWISEATWKLLDQKSTARRMGRRDQAQDIGK
jgi:hypothetical protein